METQIKVTRESINAAFKKAAGKDLTDAIAEDAIFMGLVGRGKTTIVHEIAAVRKEITETKTTFVEASKLIDKAADGDFALSNSLTASGMHSHLVIDDLNGSTETKHYGVLKDLLETVMKGRLDKKLDAIVHLMRAKAAGENLHDDKFNTLSWWAKSTTTIITNLNLDGIKGILSAPTWDRLKGLVVGHAYVIERDDSYREDINWGETISNLNLK